MRGKTVARIKALTERDIQRAGVKALRDIGLTVFVTSNGRATSNTQGCPDVFVWSHNRRQWIALEVKSPSGPVRPEQQSLIDVGAVILCRSVDEMVEACL